jgi:hypothetical protein
MAVILCLIVVNEALARNVVVCGTVTDTMLIKGQDLTVEKKTVPAVCCTVSIKSGCPQADREQYFARTDNRGFYALIVNMADNCTEKVNVLFNGNLRDRVIRPVSVSVPKGSIPDTLRQNLEVGVPNKLNIDEAMPDSIPQQIIADWEDQDDVVNKGYSAVIASIVEKLPSEYAEKFEKESESISSPFIAYHLACHYRRVVKLKPYAADLSAVMFARHHNFGGFGIGYHDNSDANNTDDGWTAKGAICLLEMKTYYPRFKEILKKTDAVVRDPCISFDGKKVLFAMSGSSKGSGYKIYEMEIDDPSNIKQLTSDPGIGIVVSDFEPCYLPNGDIAFTSTRNLGFFSDATNPTTNMFLMNGDGKRIRQVGFDQVHTFYPVIMHDGSILYTRWEFNDRNLTNSMGLFTMNPDGCHQTEWFGNQTAWPFTLIHARPIPNSDKVIAIAGGLHGPYAGEVLIIDRMKGTNGTQSIQMIAPVREAKPDVTKSDIAAGGVYSTFQTPYALDENNILVSWRKSESTAKYNLYLMDTTGSRELLAWADQSVSQPVVVKPRKIPPLIAQQANYRDSAGEFTIQNVYYGAGMEGVAKGTAKSLRVVKLHYRVQGAMIGTNMPSGPSGAFVPAIFCPVSLGACSWDAKEVLGETKIYEDGSASFKVPGRTPVYFQVLDSMGYCIATMRSWSTLQPGEKFPCFGCHENKLESPPGTGQIPKAGNPKPLERPLGIEDKPFDYPTMVQPIFDKHCVSCHTANHESGFDLSGTLVSASSKKWATSYRSLIKGIGPSTSNKAVNINTIFSTPEQQPPYSFGSSKSGIMINVLNGTSHNDKIKTEITDREKRIIACWIDLAAPHCGDYAKYLSNADSTKYMKLVAIKAEWMAIEMAGLQVGVITPDSKGIVESSRVSVQKSAISYVPALRALVLNTTGKGKFVLVDLMGNVIACMDISGQQSKSAVSVLLPEALSTGVYVARFKGVWGIEQMRIIVTK